MNKTLLINSVINFVVLTVGFAFFSLLTGCEGNIIFRMIISVVLAKVVPLRDKW